MHHHQLDQAERFASKDSTEPDAKMSTASNADETQSKKPRRHYADAFAKDNAPFPLFIVWNVLEDIGFDQEDYAKKKGPGNNSSYPQSASAAASSWQTPMQTGTYQQAGGFQGADAWSNYKKRDQASVPSAHTIIARNWMDNGGPPAQVDKATIDQVASALGIHASLYASMEAIEQAHWVKIIEQIFLESQKWATSTNVLLDNKDIILRHRQSHQGGPSSDDGRVSDGLHMGGNADEQSRRSPFAQSPTHATNCCGTRSTQRQRTQNGTQSNPIPARSRSDISSKRRPPSFFRKKTPRRSD
jgi:hypothetical protein